MTAERAGNNATLYPIFYIEGSIANYLAFYSPDLNQYIQPFQSEPQEIAAEECREKGEKDYEQVLSGPEEYEGETLFLSCDQGLSGYIRRFTPPGTQLEIFHFGQKIGVFSIADVGYDVLDIPIAKGHWTEVVNSSSAGANSGIGFPLGALRGSPAPFLYTGAAVDFGPVLQRAEEFLRGRSQGDYWEGLALFSEEFFKSSRALYEVNRAIGAGCRDYGGCVALPVDAGSVRINENSESWGEYDFDHDGKPSRIVVFKQSAIYPYYRTESGEKILIEAGYRNTLIYEVEFSGEEIPVINPIFKQYGVTCAESPTGDGLVGLTIFPGYLEDIFDPDGTGKVAFLFDANFCDECSGYVILESGRLVKTEHIGCT